MAGFDASALAEIRSWVGDTPDDTTLEAVYDRHGDAGAVALEILRGRLAGFLSSPASFQIDGDYRQDATANIRELRTAIGRLEQLQVAAGVDVAGASVTVANFTRAEARR